MDSTQSSSRILVLDFVRGCLIIAMILYHFFWDLGYFGYMDMKNVVTGLGLLIAKIIGASFIFLSGISISILSFSQTINGWLFFQKFLKLLVISLVISLSTWLVDPESFIFFGILHFLSFCYLFGYFILCFGNRLLVHISLLLVFLVWMMQLRIDLSNLWVWVGINKTVPISNDFYPLIPWGIFFLAGMLFSDLIINSIKSLREKSSSKFTEKYANKFKVILWAGRKSLIIYICHQPLFFSLFLSFNTLRSY